MKRSRILVLLILPAAVIAAELLLRIFFYEPLKLRVKEGAFVNDSILGYVEKPFTTGKFVTPSISKTITINSHGFDSRDFTARKPKGFYRIAVVGSSNENAAFVRDKPYADLLNDQFARHSDRVEVINCSVGGNGRDYSRVMLAEQIKKKFDVDFVILLVRLPLSHMQNMREEYKDYIIDYEKGNPKSRQYCLRVVDEIERRWLLRLLYQSSYIVRTACKKYLDAQSSLYTHEHHGELLMRTYISRRLSAKDQPNYIFSLDRSVDVLQQLGGSLHKQGVKLYFINYFEGYSNCPKGEGMQCIELNLRNHRSLRWQYDGHLNDKGHRLIAHKLYQQLTRGGYIPQHYLNP